MPIVRTHTAMAYAYYRQGLEKKTDHGPFSLPDATLTRKAAECKAIAANRIPKDHPDRPILLYHSLGLCVKPLSLLTRLRDHAHSSLSPVTFAREALPSARSLPWPQKLKPPWLSPNPSVRI